MSNINLATRYLPGGNPKPEYLVDLTGDFRRRDNAAFLAEVAKQLRDKAAKPGPAGTAFAPDGAACIGLLGEYGLMGYGIRQAQSLLRMDKVPSSWSHAFLLTGGLSEDAAHNRSSRQSAWIWESTLEPAGLSSHFTNRNGVGPRRIGDYSRAEFSVVEPHCVPNMAIIAIALTPKERQAILDQANEPDVAQLQYDILGLLGTWYAYLSNRDIQANPLASGQAIYCSAYIQLAYDAAGIDLAPGAHQRNTSPEHIWQGIKYFASTFRVADPQSGNWEERPIACWTCIRDPACVVFPVDFKDMPRNLRELIAHMEK
ncbi:MAG: hypothetical protein L0215_09640 [Gemmataceae bacterium]|nr:hypothetical protein [Gemmataceae bacterium]